MSKESYNKFKKFIGLKYIYRKSTGEKVFVSVRDFHKFEPYIIHVHDHVNRDFYTSSFDTHVKYVLDNYITPSEHRETIINKLCND